MLVTWLERHRRITDVALVLLVILTTVAGSGFDHRHGVGVAVAVLLALPLFARHRYPLATLAVATASTAAVVAGWNFYNPLLAAIALFTVAARCERRVSLAAGSASLAVLVLPVWSDAGWSHGFLLVSRLLPFAVAWLAGDSIGTRRRYVSELEDKADRLEREREIDAARAVAVEQARIARELHDVITHTVSVMVVQAAAANDVFESRPDRAREALRNIERTGREALEELRRVLRGERAVFAPQPGLADLDRLLGNVRATGLDVVVSVEGEARALPPAIDLSAFRIVQEALTNTLKHARARRAEVVLRYRDDELDLEIHDDGAGESGAVGLGSGLVGMRERLSLLGGSLIAGPAESGGFTVTARFPLSTTA